MTEHPDDVAALIERANNTDCCQLTCMADQRAANSLLWEMGEALRNMQSFRADAERYRRELQLIANADPSNWDKGWAARRRAGG